MFKFFQNRNTAREQAAKEAGISTAPVGSQGLPIALPLCADLIARHISVARIEPRELQSVFNAEFLYVMVRHMVLHGESLALLDVDSDSFDVGSDDPYKAMQVRIASGYEIVGNYPDEWWYRLDFANPTMIQSAGNYHAGQVIHFKHAVTPDQLWHGKKQIEAPITTTKGLAYAIEFKNKQGIANALQGRLVRYHQNPVTTSQVNRGTARVLNGRTLFESIEFDQNAKLDFSLPEYEHGNELRRDVQSAIFGLYGVPEVIALGKSGTGVREAERRFHDYTIEPTARRLEVELSTKLERPVNLVFPAYERERESAKTRGLLSKSRAYKTLIDSNMNPSEAKKVVGFDTDSTDSSNDDLIYLYQ